MKSIFYAAIFFLLSVIASLFFYRSSTELTIVLATLLGYVLGRVNQLKSDLDDLRAALSADWEERQKAKTTTKKNKNHKNKITHTVTNMVAKTPIKETVVERTEVTKSSRQTPITKVPDKTKASPEAIKPTIPSSDNPPPSSDNLDKLINIIISYFTGGNFFVRVGILILFFGVSFLLKYASDAGFFPIEYRLMLVATGAIALLIFGWRLRHTKQHYGLLLQGAGIGILYLDIFSAFSLYQLLPALATFALMLMVSLFAAALAILQDSRSLAVLGFTGGFIAPILASTGSNNYVGLFSYYLLLNIAIVVIAWFKAWRELNLLGFFFTFVVGTAWGVTKYTPENFTTTEPFLIIFFLFYVLIAVLFALRQPPKLRGYVDGSLLFGVPLAASGLQYHLVKEIEYGISLSSLAIGAFYLALAWGLWKRAGDGLKLLSEAFLALGVVFTSLAIPFALAPTHTAAAWGLEGLGLMWLGSRQNRLSVRCFGLLLQLGAGAFVLFHTVSFMIHSTPPTEMPFINASFISTLMMAIAGILSARLLSIDFEGRQLWEKSLSNLLLIWGLAWLFTGVITQVVKYYGEQWIPTALLLVSALISVIFMVSALRTKPTWQQAWIVSLSLLVVMVLVAFTQLNRVGFDPYLNSFFRHGGWIAWPLAFIALYTVIFQRDKQPLYDHFHDVVHTLTALLLIALITWQGMNLLLHFVPTESGWAKLWLAIPPTLALWLTIKAKFWPIITNQRAYQQQTGTILAIYLILWSLVAMVSRGDSDPLPWIPLLNPLDISGVIILLTLFRWWQSTSHEKVMTHMSPFKSNKSLFAISLAGLSFMWLNFTLFRIATHGFDVPYTAVALYKSGLVQTSVSILWALSGVLLTIYASQQKIRTVWITGGILLGLVVLKLFTVDLSTLNSLSRIISFLMVGLLLTSIGYFAPLPDKEKAQNVAS